MQLNGAELITRFLERQGVKSLAGIPGGTVLPIYRALADSSLNHILARHEQGQVSSRMGWRASPGRPVCA